LLHLCPPLGWDEFVLQPAIAPYRPKGSCSSIPWSLGGLEGPRKMPRAALGLGQSLGSITVNVHLYAALRFISTFRVLGLDGSNATRRIGIVTTRSGKPTTTKCELSSLYSPYSRPEIRHFPYFKQEIPIDISTRKCDIFQPKMPFGLSEMHTVSPQTHNSLEDIWRPRKTQRADFELEHHHQRGLFRYGVGQATVC
jgi:hypothetical protein